MEILCKHHSAHGTRYKFDPKTERRMDLIDSRDRPILDEWIAARKRCAA